MKSGQKVANNTFSTFKIAKPIFLNAFYSKKSKKLA